MPAPPTLAEYVDGRLRTAILSGDLAPGAKLRSEQLAAAWGVSPTPVREAFQRLAGEGMVVIEPQRGARVAEVDADDAAELYELRLTLEPLALRSAIEAGAEHGSAYSAGVAAAHDALVEAVAALGSGRGRAHGSERAQGDSGLGTYMAAHRAFHLALLEGCSNQRLHRLVVQLHDHTQRFQIAGAGYRREGDPVAEHALLCAAAVDGDADAAVAVLTAHLAATLAAVQRLAR